MSSVECSRRCNRVPALNCSARTERLPIPNDVLSERSGREPAKNVTCHHSALTDNKIKRELKTIARLRELNGNRGGCRIFFTFGRWSKWMRCVELLESQEPLTHNKRSTLTACNARVESRHHDQSHCFVCQTMPVNLSGNVMVYSAFKSVPTNFICFYEQYDTIRSVIKIRM